ncbi:hypothetical protein QAD02_016507 [Eretmocerus hayati]|uniref:Uncharacterized protein n=1 Tax=Eretmocerus hayati TaxID=131215 RepID=A0ACC2PBC8_9HYME|nr:hypothetical protein QAD02_016507 [Eretmocerus hayati]
MKNGTEYKFIPFQVHFYVFDKKDAYWLIWLHIDVATCVGMIIISGFNGMQIILTREICGLFDVLSFCSLVEETYDLVNLITELGIVVLLAMMYYYLRYASAHIMKRGANCLLIVGVNATLFLMNWVGQEVSNYSEKIFDSAYVFIAVD